MLQKHRKTQKKTFFILPKDRNVVCSCYLTIYKDVHSYYVISKFCHPHHQFHPQRGHICIHCKLVHDHETQMLKDIDEVYFMSGIGRNIHYVCDKRKEK